MEFTWFDIVLIFSLFTSPFLLGMTLFVLIIMSFHHPDSRTALQWLVLPQLVILLALWGVLAFYDVPLYGDHLYIISLPMLGSIFVFFILRNLWRSSFGPRFCSHAVGAALLIIFVNLSEPHLMAALQEGREIHQLRHVKPDSGRFINQLEDEDFRQRMLNYAAGKPGIPEATLRALLARGANPFQSTNSFQYPLSDYPFDSAVLADNWVALDIFSDLLMGDSAQAQSNRRALLQHNPMSENLYFSMSTSAEKNQRYKTIGEIVLTRMPELANDKAYARILREGDAGLIQFLWRYRQPENRMYQIQSRALLGDTRVVSEIVTAPDILKEKAASGYPESLWEFMVHYAPSPIIQAVLQQNVIRWADYQDKEGKSSVLERAIERAQKSGDDSRILTLVIRDMLTHHAEYSLIQLARGFYAEDEGLHVVSALYAGGITCQQLWQALNTYEPDNRDDPSEQRIREVCHADKQPGSEPKEMSGEPD